MNVTVEVPSVLRPRCAGMSRLTVDADNVQEVLDDIEQNFPDLIGCICDETGAIRRHVNLFVNSTLVCSTRVSKTPIRAGDVVFIFQAVSGG